MMWHEFEELAGYEVSYNTYKTIIEPMYMAVPENVSKEQFVKMLDKKSFALPTKEELKKQMLKEASHLFEICGHSTDYESQSRLEKLAHEYAKRVYGLDLVNDSNVYCYFVREYAYPAIQRGCTYPKELVIGRGEHYGECCVYERIQLIK